MKKLIKTADGKVAADTLDDWIVERLNKAERERDAWRRLAKTAQNAFEDLKKACDHPTVIQRMHPDDWKRAQNWAVEIQRARQAADEASV
jgi:hypothetical protein